MNIPNDNPHFVNHILKNGGDVNDEYGQQVPQTWMENVHLVNVDDRHLALESWSLQQTDVDDRLLAQMSAGFALTQVWSLREKKTYGWNENHRGPGLRIF